MGDSGGQELEIQLEETQQQLDQAGLPPPEGFTVDETCSANGFHRTEARRFIHFIYTLGWLLKSQNMYCTVKKRSLHVCAKNVFSVNVPLSGSVGA